MIKFGKKEVDVTTMSDIGIVIIIIFYQLDAQIFYLNMYIIFLYTFRALIMLIFWRSYCKSTASGTVTLETSEWSKLLKYIFVVLYKH